MILRSKTLFFILIQLKMLPISSLIPPINLTTTLFMYVSLYFYESRFECIINILVPCNLSNNKSVFDEHENCRMVHNYMEKGAFANGFFF